MDADGGNLRTLPLPEGTQGAEGSISWSPDGSAVVIGGCRPCNNARYLSQASSLVIDPSKLTPTAVEHAHLYIVPVDGSAVQEVLDETETEFFWPAWSPDGRSIAFGRYVCGSNEHAPYCHSGTATLVMQTVASGEQTVVEVNGGPLVWSPNARRLAFAGDGGIVVMDSDGKNAATVSLQGEGPRWSPDGQWLLFSVHGEGLSAPTVPWIVEVDGGEPRPLGAYGGWGW
jgi:Tol biopolymer transport system component